MINVLLEVHFWVVTRSEEVPAQYMKFILCKFGPLWNGVNLLSLCQNLTKSFKFCFVKFLRIPRISWKCFVYTAFILSSTISAITFGSIPTTGVNLKHNWIVRTKKLTTCSTGCVFKNHVELNSLKTPWCDEVLIQKKNVAVVSFVKVAKKSSFPALCNIQELAHFKPRFYIYTP